MPKKIDVDLYAMHIEEFREWCIENNLNFRAAVLAAVLRYKEQHDDENHRDEHERIHGHTRRRR